jgi:hypothetical protein
MDGAGAPRSPQRRPCRAFTANLAWMGSTMQLPVGWVKGESGHSERVVQTPAAESAGRCKEVSSCAAVATGDRESLAARLP